MEQIIKGNKSKGNQGKPSNIKGATSDKTHLPMVNCQYVLEVTGV